MTSFFPMDPLALDQWHLLRLGSLQRIWGEYTGAGIHVGIYDDGVQFTHPDLNDNYDASRHVVIRRASISGAPVGNEGHGTAVAGLIAAEANGTGTVGIAFGASITGVNIFNPDGPTYINAATPTGFYAAIAQSTRYDVVNHSWGATPSFGASQNADIAGSFTVETLAGWAGAAATGRSGLGTIVVKSSGNDSRDAQGEGLSASRYTITVAAVGDSGFAASYSNHGASILVAAPGSEFESNGGLGIVTTDLLGTEGYNQRAAPNASVDYTDDFGGTSAAAPIVTAVVALMLDANARLGWRDVQNILAASATHTGSAFGATSLNGTFEDGYWDFNNADNWNGGGMHIHANYGYGHLNAYNAVRMAEVWTLFAPAQVSANEQMVTTGTVARPLALPDLGAVDATVTLADAVEIEHIALTITFTHANFIDLDLYLTSPEGTRVRLLDGTAGDVTTAGSGLTWTFGIESLRGELSNGTWTVTFDDVVAGNAGSLTSIAITAYGRAVSVNDVFHFTDEFTAIAGMESERRVLTDTDGGIDWINAAAVTAGSVINLNQNAYSSIGGGSLRIMGVIENAIGGDGDDLLIGNAEANDLRGMRGADTMRGGLGNDSYVVDNLGDVVTELPGGGSDRVSASLSWTLSAEIERLTLTGTGDINGTGNALANRLDGNDGANRLDGAGGSDFIYGLVGADTLLGGAGADRLYGGLGGDRMEGGTDDDLYSVDNALDLVVELAGEGSNDRVLSTITYTLTANVEWLSLSGSANLGGTGNTLANRIDGNGGSNVLSGAGGDDSLYGLGGADTLLGGTGADRLEGGPGADRMEGGADDDTYIVDDVLDVVVELSGEGSDRVFSSVTYTLSANVERLYLTGSADLDGTGNASANRMDGNAGANELSGAGGNDVIYGLGGNDTLTGGDGADRLDGGQGADSLLGGLLGDRFVFLSAADADGDVIGDFNAAQGDKIDLQAIDSDLLLAGDQFFIWIGGGVFTGLAGQLRFDSEILEGDLNGDLTSDFQIGLLGLASLSAASIWL